jgi:transcription antitermination factor NusG
MRETPGIIGFVGGERPVEVAEDEIAAIKAQIAESEDAERPKVSLRSSAKPSRSTTAPSSISTA